jgi:hypothetical protein
MSRYELTTRVETKNPETLKLVGGTGLLNMLSDTINRMSGNSYVYSDSPFSLLDENKDFDKNDKIVQSFFNKINNVEKVFASSNGKQILSDTYGTLLNIRLSDLRLQMRKAYNYIQNALDISNDAVRLERIASKIPTRSSGHYQVTALKALDELIKLSLTSFTDTKFNNVKNYVLSGSKENYRTAARLLKDSFEELTPTENRRLAYTTLQVNMNEPFLLCPKGKFNGSNNSGAVPMEISKCRENCIDSRVDADGKVSCNYQAWLTASFEPHDKVMARLDVSRHPDNEANLLNIEEGKRKRHDDQPGFEKMLDEAKEGINKARNSSDYENSREYQLRNRKAPYSNYENKENKEFDQPIESKLNHKLDDKVKTTKVAGVFDYILNRSEDEDSYDAYRKSYLQKTAKLVEDKEDQETTETMLEDRRHNNKITKDIEALLAEDEIEFSHQYSDDDLKTFASELGLDHLLEDKREN